MKSSHAAIGLVGLALVGLWYAGGGAKSLPASRAADAPPRVAAPLTHANLSVYLVYGPDAVPDAKLMSLQEALASELAVVHETSNVNTLAIENLSSTCELFVQSGEIVKGGKQDRVVQYDMLLPPNSGAVPLPAHCVEQSRWTGRGKESAAKFDKSEYFAAGRGLRAANYDGSQQAVWANVKDNQTKLNDNLKANVNAAASPTSFQLSLESDALREKVKAYEEALKALPDDRRDVIGVAFAVNGQVVSAEVYGSNALFRKAWPKLLYANAVEAVQESDAPATAPPSPREVERFLAQGAEAPAAGEVYQTEGREGFQTGGRAAIAVFDQRMSRRVNDIQVHQQQLQALTPLAVDNVERNEEPGRARTALTGRGLGTGNRVGNTNPVRPVLNLAGNPGNNRDPEPAPLPAVQAIQTEGNRLNSNRNENNGTLTVESRDNGRSGAVFHRSYIKK